MSNPLSNNPKTKDGIESFKNSVSYKDLELAYRIVGHGESTILCFHGHGRSSKDFDFLAKANRTIISIDLFLHGDSTFDKSRIFNDLITVGLVEKLLEKLLKKEKVEKFHWVAYSQGGRFTLALFTRFADRVISLTLMAPDGMNDKNFYSWSQRRWWARRLFKRWVRHPNELLIIASALSKIKVIHPKIIDFIEYYTVDNNRLQLAHETWRGFRELRPSHKAISQTFKRSNLHFQLIIGKYDQIITAQGARKFLKSIDQAEALKELPFGHDLFKPHIKPLLLELLDFEKLECSLKEAESEKFSR